ncbi:uncharacterized protein LOC144791029 [Lissotriton helveticus]
MENQEAEGPSRKRKVKFSDKELEILIEEVTDRHEQLFGKLSHKVPDAVKRNMWLNIQSKVNAVGVAHREICNLQKRWYDLRSRAKEKIAERIKSANRTGGGPPKDTPTTPLDDLVEGTLLTEAVVGVINIDTSDLITPSEELLQELIERDLRDFTNLDIQINEDANMPSTSTAQETLTERQRVRQLLQTESEDESTQRNAVSTPEPTPTANNVRPSRRRRQSQFFRRRPRTSTVSMFEEGSTTGSHVEDKILKIQRLQGKDIRIIKGNMKFMCKNIAGMHTTMKKMADDFKCTQEATVKKMDSIAKSLESICTVMTLQHKESVHRHLRQQTTLNGQNRLLSRISNSLFKFCKQNAEIHDKINASFVAIRRGMEREVSLEPACNSDNIPVITQPKDDLAMGGTKVNPPEGVFGGSRRSVRFAKEACNTVLDEGNKNAKALRVRGRKK